MDGRGRAADNIFVERWWRPVKYEDLYLKHWGGALIVDKFNQTAEIASAIPSSEESSVEGETG
jgi:hypothetical protein